MSLEPSARARIQHRRSKIPAIPALLLASTCGWQACAQSDPNALLQQADTAFKAGYQAMQEGKLDEAQQDFAHVVRLAPQLPEGHVALGAILVQLGRIQPGCWLLIGMFSPVSPLNVWNSGFDEAVASLPLEFEAGPDGVDLGSGHGGVGGFDEAGGLELG